MKITKYSLAVGAVALGREGRNGFRGTWLVGLFVFWTCIAVVGSVRADTLKIQSDCFSSLPGGAMTTTSAGPLTDTTSCTLGGNQAFSESDLASYTALGTKITATGLGLGSGVGGSVSVLSVQLFTISGVPNGETVDLNFDMKVTGSYTLNPGSGFTGFFENTYINVDTPSGGFVGGAGTGCSVPPPTSRVCLGAGNTPASASFSTDFMSGPIPLKAGTQYGLLLQLSLLAQTGGAGSVTADFLDPASIVNILATDPTTGLPVPGVSVTSDAGITFPVNGAISATPEPSSLLLLGTGLLGLVGAARRKWFA